MKLIFLPLSELTEDDKETLWGTRMMETDTGLEVDYVILVATDYIYEDGYTQAVYFVEQPFLKSIEMNHTGMFEWGIGTYRGDLYGIGVAYK